VNDRGFLFADSVYEVTPAYEGRFLMLSAHLDRLARSLREVAIDCDARALEGMHGELLARNQLEATPFAFVYLQITRGVAPRGHAFPAPPVEPTVYAFARAVERPEAARWEAGVRAITVADQRWARPDIKATALLPNVLAQQAAVDAGAEEAIFLRDGMVMEGPHANVYAVIDGVLTTAPASNYILHGITRSLVLELARELDVPVAERAFSRAELLGAQEVLLSSTVSELKAIVEVDGHAIGNGAAGTVTRALYERFKARAAA
jgi:D-alanine transaminase